MTDSTSSEDELVAGCKALKPGMFTYGLGGLESDGPGCKATMKAVQRDVEKVIEAVRHIIAQQEREKVWREIYESPHIGGMKWRIARAATEHGITLEEK